MRRVKQIFWVLAVAFVFIAGAWFGIKLTRPLSSGSGVHELNTVVVVQQVQTLSDLVTVKYVMEKVEIVNSPPTSTLGQFVQGENRVLLLAHGIVKAGIDLKRITTGGRGDFRQENHPPPAAAANHRRLSGRTSDPGD